MLSRYQLDAVCLLSVVCLEHKSDMSTGPVFTILQETQKKLWTGPVYHTTVIHIIHCSYYNYTKPDHLLTASAYEFTKD